MNGRFPGRTHRRSRRRSSSLPHSVFFFCLAVWLSVALCITLTPGP